MTTRKRKSPKGKGRRRQPGLASRGAAAVGTIGLRGAGMLGGAGLRGAGMVGVVVAKHPSIAGATAAFLIIFSFVAANALWYQPGAHPSPFFRTRDPSSPNVLAGNRPFFRSRQDDGSNVTMFRIERPAGQTSQPAATTTTATPPAAPATRLVADIQGELVRRGLYNGAADGVIGPRTTAAILFFQESNGMNQTGEPSAELLAALQTSPKASAMTASAAASTPASIPVSARSSAVVPAERPHGDISSKAASVDPVAAAIMSSEKDIKTASSPKKSPSDPINTATMVMQIQKGLSNIAYSDVSVDGVAGEQTKTAIRHFQKHYRLPETGEPDMAVLKKLQDIGAL